MSGGTGRRCRLVATAVTFVLACLCSTMLLQAAPAGAQGYVLNNDAWVANGVVRAIVSTGSVTYLGGDFTAVGPNTGRGVSLDSATGAPDTSFPRVNGTVNCVVSDGAGGWYVGGAFTAIGATIRNRLAHLLPDGSVDPSWDPNANSTVSALAVKGGLVYAAGSFTGIGGQVRNRIAALNASTGMATFWNPNANNTVTAIGLSSDGSTVYAGGTFTTIGGQSRGRIAALSSTTALATAWNPGASSTVSAVRLAGDGMTIYIGGSFTTIGGEARNYIGALDTSTGLATAWDPGSNAAVNALELSTDGLTVYAGGTFATIGGQSRNRLAGLDAATGLATPWNPNCNSTVSALALSADGASLYAGGSFTSVGGQTRYYIAGIDVVSGLATAWDPNASGAVYALAVGGTRVYAGGSFYSIGRYNRNRIAAVDNATGAANSWNPGSSSSVYALAVSADEATVYAGGAFTSIGGQARNRIAALDAATGLATSWNPSANNAVNALAFNGGLVYAGGTFTTVGGQSRGRIAALSASTGLATSWNPGSNSTLSALAVSPDGTTVYAGGAFTSIGGQARNRIAALDAATGLATSWNPDSGGVVSALAVGGGGSTIYAGGTYAAIGGDARNNLAALDAATGLATPWNPDANNTVSALSLNGSFIVAGGSFGYIGGQSHNYLASLDLATGSALDFEPGPNAAVLAVCAGTRLFAGGSFTTVGGQEFTYFAGFQYPPPRLTGVSPSRGDRGQTLAGVEIQGSGFRDVAMTVQLKKGVETITGTGVTRVSPTLVTADFTIPGGATVADDWDVCLRHDDDLKGSTLTDAFSVEYPPPRLTGVSPSRGDRGQTLAGVEIQGSGFRDVAMTVQLKKGVETITGTGVTRVSPTLVTADFTIPGGATVADDWDVCLRHDDDLKGSTLTDAFSVEYPPPSAYSITPGSANNDGVVHITNLAGSGFRTGTTARLRLAGKPDIVASDLVVASPNKIVCDFDLDGAATGLWDVSVTNVDGKNGTLPGGFAVQHEGPTVTDMNPAVGINNGPVHIDSIRGTSFRAGATATLRRPGQPDIVAYNLLVESPDEISCDFNLAGKASGKWDVVVRNDDAQWGMLEDGFAIENPAPVVTGIAPDHGNRGESLEGVTISGSDFRDVSMTVLLRRGGETVAGKNVTWVNTGTVTADFDIPAGATVSDDWDLFLQNNDDAKASTLPGAFSVEYPPPVVMSVTPESGDNSGTVTITNLAGSGFRSGASVALARSAQPDIPATSVTVLSSSRITCEFDLSGAVTGLWDVNVTNADSKSGALLAGFEVQYPPPTVSAITPSFANNDGSVHISDLAGSCFRPGATVKLRKTGSPDIDATGVVVSAPGRIECDFDLDGKSAGAWSVLVTNDDTKSGTLVDGFDLQHPPPVVAGISPDHGNKGQLLNNVILSGADFRNISMTVRLLNGAFSIDGTDVHRVSESQLTADFYIPPGAPEGPGWDVFVQNNDDGKSSTLVGAFTVEFPDPVVTSISPQAGENDGVVQITGLLGANFRAGATVRLSMVDQPDIWADAVSVASAGRITCEFDLTGAATGAWDVTVTNADLKSATLPGAFTVRYPAPTVTGVAPSVGCNTGPVQVSVAGAHFRAGATVRLRKSGRPDIITSGVIVTDPSLIVCDFDLSGKPVGKWNVIVTNVEGKSGTLEEGFTIENPAPVLGRMSPSSGPAQTTLRNVLIEGENFRDTSIRVELSRGSDTIFGTNVRWESDTRVLCDLPLDGAPEGPGWTLFYASIDDGKSATLPDAFAVTSPPPQRPFVSRVTPGGGTPGHRATVEGVNFGAERESSTVTFNGVPAAEYPFWSDDRIEVVVPGGASTGPVVVRTAGGSSNDDRCYTIATPTWYLAEGSTAWGFSTRLTVMNPNNADLHARVIYMLSGGGTVQDLVALPALSQVTINPRALLGEADFSATVTCVEGQTISVDRTMSWKGPGAEAGEEHCSVGTTLPSRTWYMPEGCSAYGFETWLLVQNPNAREARIGVTYMIEGVGPRTVTRTVPPRARATYNMADDIGAFSASIKVSSDRPVIAERATYRNDRREGQGSIGATYPSRVFYLPEGSTAWGYTTYVLVQNPNGNPAEVTLTYMTGSGPVRQRPLAVGPRSRMTVDAAGVIPGKDFSVKVTATQPVVAERAMYWTSEAGSACHDSIGLPQPHSVFYLPDGQTGRGRETFTLVQNPNSTSVDVEVVYYGANGSFDVVVRRTLEAGSRATFNMAERLPAGRAAVLVRCMTRGKKVLAERSMYRDGRSSGTCTIGGYAD